MRKMAKCDFSVILGVVPGGYSLYSDDRDDRHIF